MNKSYIMSVSHGAVKLYGGRLEDKGSYSVFAECQKNTVEEMLAQDFLKEDKQETKIGVIFSHSFHEDEKSQVLDNMSRRGFVQTREYQQAAYICEYIKGHPYALILSAYQDNLYADFCDTSSKQVIAHTQIIGAGKDPRIAVLAEAIWKKLTSEASYLNKEEDFDKVKDTAKQFLLSGKSELDGTISLEGENHDFFIRRRDADIEHLQDHGSSTILSQLSNFANQVQLDKAATILVLSEGLTNNSYFHNIFNGFTSDMKEINEEWTQAVLSAMMNELNGINFTHETHVGIDGLPLQNINVSPSDTSIHFNITFPKGAQAIDIFRDGTKTRTITEAQFSDTDLLPNHIYRYGFVAIFKDEHGYEKRAEESKMDIATTAIQLPEPISLQATETAEEALLSWSNPSKGTVRIYHSTRPFPYHENDVIKDINALDYPSLSSLENSYRVQKDYCGERFFLPVTIIDNLGVAGKQQVVTSMVPPKGIRIDSTDVNHVKVVWIWDDVSMIRIKWRTGDGNEQWKDIAYDGQVPEYEIPLPSKSRNITVIVTALYQKRDGSILESEETTLQATLSSIKVDFISAKSEARFFMHKDEYTLTLRADGEPPCDLYVLLEEGNIPLDLTNFKSYLTISRQELADGKEKKFPLTYHRMQKNLPLYFRIIAADRSLPFKVVPETQKIK